MMTDLNLLVPSDAPLYLLDEDPINDRGEIAGFGATSTGELHAYLAIPCDKGHAGAFYCKNIEPSAFGEREADQRPKVDPSDVLKFLTERDAVNRAGILNSLNRQRGKQRAAIVGFTSPFSQRSHSSDTGGKYLHRGSAWLSANFSREWGRSVLLDLSFRAFGGGKVQFSVKTDDSGGDMNSAGLVGSKK